MHGLCPSITGPLILWVYATVPPVYQAYCMGRLAPLPERVTPCTSQAVPPHPCRPLRSLRPLRRLRSLRSLRSLHRWVPAAQRLSQAMHHRWRGRATQRPLPHLGAPRIRATHALTTRVTATWQSKCRRLKGLRYAPSWLEPPWGFAAVALA